MVTTSDGTVSSRKILTELMFRLLPVQIFLAAIGAVNGIVSSFFASNYIGVDAMTAVGLFAPINLLVNTSGTILVSGSSILCGKYMGQNERDRMHNVFTLDIVLAVLTGGIFTALYIIMGGLDLTGIIAKEESVRHIFNIYLIGQAVGVIPFLLGSQLTIFLSMENKARWSFTASIAYILANLAFNILFVVMLDMEALGLALASGLGMWLFMGIQAIFYLSGRSQFRLRLSGLRWSEGKSIVGIGFPGASTYVYQTIRGFIVNELIQRYVGGAGVSAFAAANNLLALFWAVPAGMLAVSRMLISISIGEEDRQSLTDVMRIALRKFIPLMCVISALLMLCGEPLTWLFFRDPSQPVYMMTVWGMRLLPVCMPLAIVLMHFVCYAQASGKTGFVHSASLLDGVICVAGFSAILVPLIGMNGVYIANILNGVVCIIAVIVYSVIKNRRFPSDMDELMVIPDDFGVAEGNRMDLTVHSMEQVVNISQRTQAFCLERGVDDRRAYLAGLAMEEMAGNIVEHGFNADGKKHAVDVRVSYKNDEVILRLRDNCQAFDPESLRRIAEPDDPAQNIGIRMIYGIVKNVEYQNILGLNVLLMRI